MAWARLDDGFHDHPKVDGLSLAAVGLYTLCLTWAHRHRRTAVVQGHITDARVRKLAGKQSDALVSELLASGLWEPEDAIGGYVIHDFEDYLPKQRDPEELKRAGRKGAASRWQTDSKPDGKLPSDEMANDGSRASAPAFPSRPVPKEPSQDLGGERPETLRPVEQTEHPNSNYPPGARYRCAAHKAIADPPPCNGCKATRERAEAEDHAIEERERERRDRELETARNACPDCEGTGKVLDADKKPTRRQCQHPKVRRAS